MSELSEEEVFANDIDPIDALREIRKTEGVKEENLPVSDNDTSSQKANDTDAADDGTDELDNIENSKPSESVDENNNSAPTDNEELDTNVDSTENESEEDTSADTDKADAAEEKTEALKKKFMANGKEFEFTEAEMLEQFEVVFGQAIDYTQKTQKIAPYRKMISALEDQKITHEQLNVAIDALNGNPKALQALMEMNKIEAFDITKNEEDSPYTPPEYGKNEEQLDIDEVITKISGDQEYQITVDVVDNQWDDTSRKTLSSNPSMIQGLHTDIKTGVYDRVAPAAMKLKVLDGNRKSDLEYYMLAGEQVLAPKQETPSNTGKTAEEMNQDAQDAVEDFDQASSEAQRKRSASTTRQRADRKGVIDYLEDDDENYDAWYKNLMASN